MQQDPEFVRDLESKAAAGDSACQAAVNCLKAMRSVLATRGCAGNSTAYFAAAVTTLQTHLSGTKGAEADGTTSALLLILRKSLGSVPATVVQGHLNNVINLLTAVLKRGDSEELVKQCLGCIAVLSGIAFDVESRPNRKLTKPAITFVADARPAVRQRAHMTVVSIARRAADANDEQTLTFISEHLAQLIASARPDKKTLDNSPARHAIVASKGVVECLPQDKLLTICEAVLKLPGILGQHPVCVEAFEFLAAFIKENAEERGSLQKALVSALLPQLLALPLAVLNVAYAAAHARLLAAMISVSLASTNSGAVPAAAVAELPTLRQKAVTQLLALFAERDPSLVKTVREEAQDVLAVAAQSTEEGVPFLQLLPELCRALLSYERKAVWPNSLPVIAALFDAIGEVRLQKAPANIPAFTTTHFENSKVLLQELVAARDAARGAEMNTFGKEIDSCFSSAISTFGPELVLSVANLQVLEASLSEERYEQRSRSWLLLILKDSCRRTELAFFSRAFLPLASALRARSKQAVASSPVLAKKYAILVEQVWALLPGCCTEPLDMRAALLSEGGRLAKQMVSVLLNEPELRGHIWLAFKKACDTAREPPSALSKALVQDNMQCMKQLSQHVMPEMFTTFVKMHEEGQELDPSRVAHDRHIAMEAIKSFAAVADQQLLVNHFKNVVSKLLKLTAGVAENAAEQPASHGQTAAPLADLANVLVPLLPADQMELVLKVFTPMLQGGGAHNRETIVVLQKGGYRAMQSVLLHPHYIPSSGPGATKVLHFWATLRDARETCEAPALKTRLQALQTLLDLMQERLACYLREPTVRSGFLECLKTILPEVMEHLRDQSTTVREAARDCLHVAATTALHQELETELVTLISAGLTSPTLTPSSKASAIDALSRLLYEHSYIMTMGLLDKLVNFVLVLLEDPDAQVYRAALKFGKVVVFVLPREKIDAFLLPMMRMFKSRHLASNKILVRRIMERFVKVIPAERLSQAVPKAHQPLLHYVQKQLLRRHRPKAVLQAAGEEEDDGEGGNNDADMEDTQKGKPAQSWEAFRGEEEGDEEIVAGSSRRRRRRAEPLAPGEPEVSPVMANQSVQALLDAWEAESDDSDGGGKKSKGKRKRDGTGGETMTWIQEDQDVPLDFMSAQAAQSVLTMRPPERKRQRADMDGTAQGRAETLRRHGLKFADDGRLVVDDEANEAAMEDGEGGGQEGEEKKFTIGTSNKEKPLSKLAAMREARARAKAKAKVSKRGTHLVKGLENSKPGKKKAQGDVRKKGSKLEPYAYVKLNPKALKEKFKDKNEQAFARVVQGAKRGIIKGNKARARELKLRKAREAKKRNRPKKAYKVGSR